jgi:hypothetical protein
METGRALGTRNDWAMKEDWVKYAFEHHALCDDMLKMLDDLPMEAFEMQENERYKNDKVTMIMTV